MLPVHIAKLEVIKVERVANIVPPKHAAPYTENPSFSRPAYITRSTLVIVDAEGNAFQDTTAMMVVDKELPFGKVFNMVLTDPDLDPVEKPVGRLIRDPEPDTIVDDIPF